LFLCQNAEEKLVKFVRLTLITLASCFFGVRKPLTGNDLHVGVMHTKNRFDSRIKLADHTLLFLLEMGLQTFITSSEPLNVSIQSLTDSLD